jgi:hypothetical protein
MLALRCIILHSLDAGHNTTWHVRRMDDETDAHTPTVAMTASIFDDAVVKFFF